MQLETERLILRELTPDDFDDLYEILSDEETMKFYPHPFSKDEIKTWIARNIERYATFGFGLWAVILKENGKFIGECGVTMQNINHFIYPEIGYHTNKKYQRKGYASEAAQKCKDYIFENTPFKKIYSYMKYTNVASYSTALANGMHFVEEYDDPVNVKSRCYAITRDEWLANKVKINK